MFRVQIRHAEDERITHWTLCGAKCVQDRLARDGESVRVRNDQRFAPAKLFVKDARHLAKNVFANFERAGFARGTQGLGKGKLLVTHRQKT